MADDKEKYVASDYNLKTVTPTELSKHLSLSVALAQNVAVFGLRGSGKTEIAKQVIEEAGCRMVYLNLSVLERVDLNGYPNMFGRDPNDKFVSYALPEFYRHMCETPGDSTKPVVLLLDEVDKVDVSVQAPLLELTQFHTINGVPLPNLKAVIMTGNLMSEGSQRPSMPLLDRAEAYIVRPDMNSFMEWGSTKGKMHPSIMAFLKENPKNLFGEAAEDDRYKDCSPRSWARASDILNKGESQKCDTSFLKDKVSGCVGKMVGKKFEMYFDYYADLVPFADRIESGQEPIERIAKEYQNLMDKGRGKQIVLCMMIGTRLANIIDAQTKPKNPSKVSPYAADVEAKIASMSAFLNQIEPEDLVITFRSQVGFDRIMKHGLDKRTSICEPIKKVLDRQGNRNRK